MQCANPARPLWWWLGTHRGSCFAPPAPVSLPLQALQILASCLSTPLPRAREQALEAFTSWLKLTGGMGLSGPMLMQSPLVRCAAGLGAAIGWAGRCDFLVLLWLDPEREPCPVPAWPACIAARSL